MIPFYQEKKELSSAPVAGLLWKEGKDGNYHKAVF